jgi:hypothetical protein
VPETADAARCRQPLQPCGDVDAVAINVAAVGDHVAEIDPDPEPDPAVLGYPGLAVDHCPLQFHGTAHRVDDAREFRQHAIASILDDAAGMLADLRVEELAAMRLEALVRALLVRAHQPRIARHIGSEDRGKTAGRGHGSGRPLCFGYRRTLIIHHTARTTMPAQQRDRERAARAPRRAGCLISIRAVDGLAEMPGVEPSRL